MENLKMILDVIGYVATLIVIFATIRGFYRWAVGISPALSRLGKGLANRQIAIFANGDDFNSLKSLLLDSKLFKEKNVIQITVGEIRKSENISLFLMHWKSFKSHLDSILTCKKDSTALIVYAPQEEGFLSPDEIKKINQHRNVIVVNMRGRLLNDIVTSLITTSYEKK